MVEDFPIKEVAAKANEIIEGGGMVFQKWTCDACGERVTFEQPNTFYMTGTHEDCTVDTERVTNIAEKGCNYLVLQASDPEKLREVFGA